MKRMIALFSALCLCVSLTACGKAAKLPIGSPRPAADEEYVGFYEGGSVELELLEDHIGYLTVYDAEGDYEGVWDVAWGNGEATLEDGRKAILLLGKNDILRLHFQEERKDYVLNRVVIPPEVGNFVHHYEEEYEGQIYESDYWISLYRDGTGMFFFEDETFFYWKDGVMDDGDGYEFFNYRMEGKNELVLYWDRDDGTVAEESFVRTLENPYDHWEGSQDWQGGWEYSMYDLEDHWALVCGYVTTWEETEVLEQIVGEYTYLDITDADELSAKAHFHYERDGEVLDFPEMDVEYVEDVLDENYYNQAWYAVLSGEGTLTHEDGTEETIAVGMSGEPEDTEIAVSIYDTESLVVYIRKGLLSQENPDLIELYMCIPKG